MLKANTNFEVSTILCWTWLPTWSQMSFYLFDVQVWTTDRAIWAAFSRLQFILFPSPTFSPHLDILIAKFPQTPPNPRNARIISTFSDPNELEIQLMQSCFGFMDRRNGQTFFCVNREEWAEVEHNSSASTWYYYTSWMPDIKLSSPRLPN